MDILILAGGLSHERDVSIRSGRRVSEALRDQGHTVSLRDVDSTLIDALRTGAHQVVWPLLHGASGEDGSLQGMLELFEAPFVGADSHASRVSWSKPVAKAVLRKAGIGTPDWVALPQSIFREVGADKLLDAAIDHFGEHLVVKPARGGSALGVTLVKERADLARAMVNCFAYSDVALMERAVNGTEVAVSVVGTGADARALPAVEIVCDGPYDYDARYNAGRVEYFAPARLSEADSAAVANAALGAHRALDLRDLSRVDIILADGVANVLDINIAPGMTETSLFPQAAEAAGLSLGEVGEEIVAAALTRVA